MKDKFIKFYLKVAQSVADELSQAKRLKVGAVAVKGDNILAYGYNGTPSGWDNNCEYMDVDIHQQEVLVTKPEVLHAETNLISKISKSTQSSEGAALFITHAPCFDCAKFIYQSGFKQVYYSNPYRCTRGVDFLIKCNVLVRHIPNEEKHV